MKILVSRTYWFILVLSILLISACYTLPQPLFAEDDLTIFVADEPAGKATDTVTLNMTNSTSVTLPLYLSQSITSTTVLTNVRLLGHLADEAGQALSNAQITFATVANVTGAISFTIPASGKQLLVNVTVTNLPTNGEFQGYLLADFDGKKNEKISTLTVRNFPKPAVNLVGITTYQSTSAAYHQRFQLVTENQTDVDDLRVQIAPFTGPDGQQVGTSWTVDGKSSAEPIKVAGLSAATLEISATLPTTGTYTSNSSLLYDGLRHPITFTVERIQPTLSALPLEVTGIATSEGYLLPSWLNHRFQIGSFRFGLGWSKDVSVWMTLRATNNEPLTLNIPTIVTMTRQGINDTQLQATVVEQISNDAAIVLTGTDTISLEPGTTQRLNLALLDLSRAGVYKGAIRFGGPNASPIQYAVTFIVKEWWAMAVLLILLGVVGGTALRFYTTYYRPGLLQQINLLGIRDQLKSVMATGQAEADPAEQQVRKDFQTKLEDALTTLTRKLELGQLTSNIDGMLALYVAKIALFQVWVKYYRKVSALQPPELGEPFRQRLDSAKELLIATSLSDSTDLDTKTANTSKAKEDLEKFDAEIKQALEAKLTSQITELKDKVEKLDESEGKNKIKDLLDQASKAIDKDFPKAQALYNDAVEKYTQAVKSSASDSKEALNQARQEINGTEFSSANEEQAAPQATKQGDAKQPEVLAVRMPYPKTTRGVLRLITIGDWSRLVVTMLVAVLVGLKLFWMDNSTWGGGNDYIIALVWGFGVDQLSSATVGNINTLYSKLQGTGT